MYRFLKVKSCAKSDVGLIRETNEDFYKTMDNEGFFIVADGMGGHNAGEVAASKAVDYMCSRIKTLFQEDLRNLNVYDMQSHIESIIENTNLWIHHLGLSKQQFFGMGTTLCSMLFFKKFVIFANVGDSRTYRIRENKLEQLTTDHLRKDLYKKFATSTESPNNLSYRKVLTRAIGTTVTVLPDVKHEYVKKKDLYLMCSDGLTDVISDEEIKTILNDGVDISESSVKLIDSAKARGGLDNITVILVEVESL